MPRDAGGTFSRTNGSFNGSTTWAQQAASADKVISSARHDTHDQDMADGMTDSLSRSGKGAMQANLNAGGFKIENLANGTASADAVNFSQIGSFVSSDTVNRFTEQQQWDKGADVASAATLLTLTDGNSFKVTGTTTIAGMTARPVGTWVSLEFDTALTLTHGTDWFLNNNGDDILTEPGDRAICIMATATQWQVFVQRATGQAIRTKDPAISQSFTSTEQTITGGTILSVAHGMGVEPMMIAIVLVCKTAQGGFSIGDRVFHSKTGEYTDNTATRGVTVRADATNIEVIIGSAGQFSVTSPTTFSSTPLTAANWDLIVKAIA